MRVFYNVHWVRNHIVKHVQTQVEVVEVMLIRQRFVVFRFFDSEVMAEETITSQDHDQSGSPTGVKLFYDVMIVYIV